MKHILFPITFECNLSCEFCSAKSKRGTVVDIPSNVEAIKARAGEAEWVFITGGEPFLIEGLPAVCNELKKTGLKVGVTTNGTIFRPGIASCADRIGISIDGDREFHDAYRGEGTFDKALDLFHAVKGRCETVIMSVAFAENKDALMRLKSVIEELDPDYWQIQNDYGSTNQIPENIERTPQ